MKILKEGLEDLDLVVKTSDSLNQEELHKVTELFDTCYQSANLEYMKKSMEVLRYIAMAFKEDRLVGFGLGDSKPVNLPGISEPQVVAFGGLTCIVEEYRKKGLLWELEKAACLSNGVLKMGQPFLQVGRAAHPVSLRLFRKDPNSVPNHQRALKEVHLETGKVIADIYGVELYPGSLRVKGHGKPIGHPKVNMDVTEEEWRVFNGVDRNIGDSILGMSWYPKAPEGW